MSRVDVPEDAFIHFGSRRVAFQHAGAAELTQRCRKVVSGFGLLWLDVKWHDAHMKMH